MTGMRSNTDHPSRLDWWRRQILRQPKTDLTVADFCRQLGAGVPTRSILVAPRADITSLDISPYLNDPRFAGIWIVERAPPGPLCCKGGRLSWCMTWRISRDRSATSPAQWRHANR